MHILIVDDSKFMRGTIIKALNQIGSFTYAQAANGKVAFEKLNQEVFDLVMTDWNMPEMNGLELVQHIRRESLLPILMLTTVGAREEVKEAIKAGVNNYLLKPLQTEELKLKLGQIFPNRF